MPRIRDQAILVRHKFLLIGVLLLTFAVAVLLWRNQQVELPAASGRLSLVGRLAQSGTYFTLAVKKGDQVIWYVANSQDPKITPTLTELVGKRVRLAGTRLGTEGALLIVTEVNGRELLSADEAVTFFQTPTFEEFYLGLSDAQKSCIEQLFGVDQVNDLIAQHAVGIPPEKTEAINQCLVGA
ncbi:hypothetical protein HY523_00555 [Candidatus Berkelbacteria bacterium]|nr:hypothetical protein [Candidatus Berkelbacteria bacterium]